MTNNERRDSCYSESKLSKFAINAVRSENMLVLLRLLRTLLVSRASAGRNEPVNRDNVEQCDKSQ